MPIPIAPLSLFRWQLVIANVWAPPKPGRNTMAKKKRKRCSDQEDDTGEIDEDRFSEMARSERKRYREKKRRNDVNKGCNDLLSILIEVDPLLRAEAEERAQRDQWKGTDRAHDDNLLSRVDLISRTVGVLRRVHQENECRKQIIEQLLKSNGGIGSALPTAAFLPQSKSQHMAVDIDSPSSSLGLLATLLQRNHSLPHTTMGRFLNERHSFSSDLSLSLAYLQDNVSKANGLINHSFLNLPADPPAGLVLAQLGQTQQHSESAYHQQAFLRQDIQAAGGRLNQLEVDATVFPQNKPTSFSYTGHHQRF
ncbi:predicted protein [Phaeodactylum tricornutum CCAP 1055/1]|uniref:BHLH domain-containing protein n=2 Tax=Phaeodactylum tricornutum TaxID=2850 RepID=B7FS06_PHATC|nr:predicted protein [Phaeodactylum tricornutum CCAP 1055/1]EEC50708.1 predicted protein [Phaeodactylum tricornutum CCAP 1055/1]|eukprot:XP_002177894.1 predicted protein [Phaeodactylum tricornutum CCAP 1055/1]